MSNLLREAFNRCGGDRLSRACILEGSGGDSSITRTRDAFGVGTRCFTDRLEVDGRRPVREKVWISATRHKHPLTSRLSEGVMSRPAPGTPRPRGVRLLGPGSLSLSSPPNALDDGMSAGGATSQIIVSSARLKWGDAPAGTRTPRDLGGLPVRGGAATGDSERSRVPRDSVVADGLTETLVAFAVFRFERGTS